MKTAASQAAPSPRPKDCESTGYAGFACCVRCGIAWETGQDAPPCAPITFQRLLDALEEEALRCEGSHDALVSLRAAGLRANPLPSLARAAELRAAARLITRERDRRRAAKDDRP